MPVSHPLQPIPASSLSERNPLELSEVDWAKLTPKRLLKQKELAAVFDIDERQLRRIQNSDHRILPLKRPGSCRIIGYSADEVAKLAVYRARQGKQFCPKTAAQFGFLDFLQAVITVALTDQARKDPARFGELRLELLLDILAYGDASPLAQQMGLTIAEIPAYETMARTLLKKVLSESPSTRPALAAQIQASLISIVVNSTNAHQNIHV